ncbi:hypothetical protein ACE1ET_17500 [Saccharicrinis sp. FJH62]|uniref:hypothetical protein n=1 Tax=Saccharicrinis sp. FJH62 TaxID=3344657 RepID=UPI0035D41F97
MKQLIKYFCLASMILFLMSSCEKDDPEVNHLNDNDFIKSEVSNDNIISNYKYNAIRKIAETEEIYFYNKYLYDNDGRLTSRETAIDPSVLSSSLPTEKTELMTGENSSISSRQIFKYDENGRLLEIENYFKTEEDKFELRSKQSFEFIDGKIVTRNIHNENGEITQFNVYEYDENWNVKNEKYYSYLSTESTQPKLISEKSFKFDNKKNPFKILNELGSPGLFTNSNNIIETNLIRHEEVPGFEKYSTSTTSYEYNQNDYPIKVITENSEYEYRY